MLTISYVDSLTITLSFDPLTIETISFAIRPYSIAMPMPVFPVSNIKLVIDAFKLPFSLSFIKIKLSSIDTRVSNFYAFSLIAIAE